MMYNEVRPSTPLESTSMVTEIILMILITMKTNGEANVYRLAF